jgi:hypothetical protein
MTQLLAKPNGWEEEEQEEVIEIRATNHNAIGRRMRSRKRTN